MRFLKYKNIRSNINKVSPILLSQYAKTRLNLPEMQNSQMADDLKKLILYTEKNPNASGLACTAYLIELLEQSDEQNEYTLLLIGLLNAILNVNISIYYAGFLAQTIIHRTPQSIANNYKHILEKLLHNA
ncbi:MAG: hypothetical protein EP298_09010 [Gammaproteobacteria bacterium]|nr:MAG: hypothetical protein EP298_09010 [Gammaproteobacteria bacterium]UTW42376.1 hypothetical protein KFE69_12980 [bacterium SCSIO 12844]